MEQTKAVKTVKKGRMIAGVVFFILTALCFVLATAVMADAFKLWEDPNVGTALALIAVIPLALIFLGGQLLFSVVTVVCVAKYVRCGVKSFAVAAVVIIALTCVLLVVSAIVFFLLMQGNGATPPPDTAE